MLCFLVPSLKEILSVSSKKLTEVIILLTAEIFLPDAAFSSLHIHHPGSTNHFFFCVRGFFFGFMCGMSGCVWGQTPAGTCVRALRRSSSRHVPVSPGRVTPCSDFFRASPILTKPHPGKENVEHEQEQSRGRRFRGWQHVAASLNQELEWQDKGEWVESERGEI